MPFFKWTFDIEDSVAKGKGVRQTQWKVSDFPHAARQHRKVVPWRETSTGVEEITPNPE